jgi:hypothetical protein
MDSVLKQPLRVVRNLAAQSSERSCCLGRLAQRSRRPYHRKRIQDFYYHVKTSAGISGFIKEALKGKG